MQIQRDDECLQALPDNVIGRVVIVTALAMAVHQRALETQLDHRAFQLRGGLLGVLHGQGCKTCKTGRMFGNAGRQIVVVLPCTPDGGCCVRLALYAWPRLGKDGQCNARLVHFFQPQRVDVRQSTPQISGGGRIDELHKRF